MAISGSSNVADYSTSATHFYFVFWHRIFVSLQGWWVGTWDLTVWVRLSVSDLLGRIIILALFSPFLSSCEDFLYMVVYCIIYIALSSAFLNLGCVVKWTQIRRSLKMRRKSILLTKRRGWTNVKKLLCTIPKYIPLTSALCNRGLICTGHLFLLFLSDL